MNARHALVALVVAFVVSGCVDQGDVCCDCLIANDCWGTDTCFEDPLGSCKYTIGSGDLPAYADGDVNAVCFSVGTECADQNCASECAGEFPET